MTFSDGGARKAFFVMQQAYRHGESAGCGKSRVLSPSRRRTGGRRYRRVGFGDRSLVAHLSGDIGCVGTSGDM